MQRYHVHLMLTERIRGDEIASATITIDAESSDAAEAEVRELLASVSFDVQEIEEAE